MSEHEKDTSKPFLAGIKQLVNQILFVSDVPRQQICDEHIGKGVFPVKRVHHCLFLNPQNSAIRHRGCRAHAQRLSCKRTFAEETLLTQYADRRFLAILGDNGESYLACLQIENCVGGVPLREDGLLLRKGTAFLPSPMVARKFLGSKSRPFLGAATKGIVGPQVEKVPEHLRDLPHLFYEK